MSEAHGRVLRAREGPGLRSVGALVVFGALLAWLGMWALIRPPGQAPDEAHHLAKALSVTTSPWVTVGDVVRVPRQTWTPFAVGAGPPDVARLPFRPDEKLSLDDIARLRGIVASPPAPAPDGTVALRTQAAGYPTPIYWLFHALAGRAARGTSMSAYASFYVWRGAAVLVAAALWTMVVVLCTRRWPEGRSAAVAGLLLLAPTTTFVSSSIGLDGAQFPLAILSLLLLDTSLSAGRGLGPLAAAALATALSGPRGLLALPALIAAAGVAGLTGATSRRAAARATTVLCFASLTAWLAFYRFGSVRLYGDTPPISYGEFLVTLAWRAPALWRQLWGKFGWLDYALPHAWYIGLTALLAGAVWSWWCRRHDAGIARVTWPTFAIAYAGVIVAVMAWHAPVHGFRGAGRYFLPSLAGLAICMHQRGAWPRACLLWLAAMSLAFVHETVTRYYVDGWMGAWAALPW